MQKITTKNTWSLPLIDHMDELISEDTNFQKASCAIDASVQIYSSRVDDVWTSSYRVLENLNRSEAKPTEVEAETNKGVSKRVRVPVASPFPLFHTQCRAVLQLGAVETLETNLANITVKKFETECDIDPMFHKVTLTGAFPPTHHALTLSLPTFLWLQMSKNFDEGGARGLLLNQLSVQEGCRLAFDSIDVADVDSLVAAPAAASRSHDTFDCSEFATKMCASIVELHMCPQLDSVYARLSNGVPFDANVTLASLETSALMSAGDVSVSVASADHSVILHDEIVLEDAHDDDDGCEAIEYDMGGDDHSEAGTVAMPAPPAPAVVSAQALLESEGLADVLDARLLKDFLMPAVKSRAKEAAAKERKAAAGKKDGKKKTTAAAKGKKAAGARGGCAW